MHITFVVKASTKVGFGHLIRSRSLANQIEKLLIDKQTLQFCIIGEQSLEVLLSGLDYPVKIFESEEHFIASHEEVNLSDIVVFDLLSVEDNLFELTTKARWRISISPIFSHLNDIDTFIHRSKYFDNHLLCKNVIKGLEFAIIQDGCRQIDAGSYKRNLNEERLSLAISMGGGDAANKTLQVIQRLNKLQQNFTIWVMLGEGYKHSYDALIAAAKESHHEIILAKTNESMWRVLSLASLLILPGGVTSYEATYAGLPTLNIVESERQKMLVKELFEEGVSLEINGIQDPKMLELIHQLDSDRAALYSMHLRSKGLIDGRAGERIFELMVRHTNSI